MDDRCDRIERPRVKTRDPSELTGALKAAYYDIARRLNAPRQYVRFATTPQHDGSAHIETTESGFAYVITERGGEHERRETLNDDDVLFWLVSDLTRQMASQYELTNRISTADSRRILFQRHMELLGIINRDWQTRKELEYKAVLEQYPYYDTMGEQGGERGPRMSQNVTS